MPKASGAAAPPPLVPPAPPRAPLPPLSPGKKIGFAIVAVAVLLAVGGGVFISQRNRAPSAGLVRDAINARISSSQLQVTELTFTVTPAAEPGRVLVAYQGEAKVTEPRYEFLDPVKFLSEELKLDPEAWQKTRKTLSGRTAPRIFELAGLKDVDPVFLTGNFLREVTPVGTKISISGTVPAVKEKEGWKVRSQEFTETNGPLQGSLRNAHSGPAVIISDPAEMKRIRDLAAAQTEVPAKVEQGRLALLEERKAQQEKIVAELLETIKAGTVYGGTATLGTDAPVKVFLEVTAVNARSKQVTAWLRNDGSWNDRRQLKGSFAFDADSETLTLTLASPSRQAVKEAGPLLSDQENLRVVLQLNAGKLAANEDGRVFALSRLSEAEVAAAKEEMSAASSALLQASATGKVYRGVIRGREDSATFDYLLRFNSQDREAATGTATLEPAGRENVRRTFRGTVAANRYHPGGLSLRLESRANDAAKSAAENSPAGQPRDSTITLRLQHDRLQGEAGDFSYDFAPLSPEEEAQLAAAAAEREQALLAIVKADTAYPGTARLKGATEKIRLRFRQVDPHGAVVDAVVESLDHPGVNRELHGSADPITQQLTFSTTGKGRPSAGKRAGVKFPPLVRPEAQTITLKVTGQALTGELPAAGGVWNVDFPVAGATAVPGGSAGDYPTENGVYVWKDGTWQALPRNGGRIGKSTMQAIGGFLNALSKRSSSTPAGDKQGELSFDGDDPVPTVPGNEVVVIHVGPINREREEKYPALSNYPVMEMSPTYRDAKGNRKVPLTRIAANVPIGGFREHRVPGILEQVSDTVILLTCSQPLTPGPYAISVNDEAFELNVE